MTGPIVIWFTGLSGSGKTTLAGALRDRLVGAGKSVRFLDGDAVRKTIHAHLGFTPEDIKKNNRLVAEWCAEHGKKYDFVIVSMISPFAQTRSMARKIIGLGYTEVYLKAPLEEVIKRDVKGLYRKALSGEIENFIGISPGVPYEEPVSPDLVLETARYGVDACLKKLIEKIGV